MIRASPRHTARGDNLDELYTVVRPVIAEQKTAWLAARLTERGIMNGKVNTYREFLQEEQVMASGIMAWLDTAGRAGAGADAKYSRAAAVRVRHEARPRAKTGRAYEGGAGGAWL